MFGRNCSRSPHDFQKKPPRGGAKRNFTNVIKARLIKWKDNVEEPETERRQGRSSKKKESELLLAAALTSKLEDGNFKAAVRLICSEDTPAPMDADTMAKLHLKHPTRPADRRPPRPPEPAASLSSITVNTSTILHELRSFPPGSSGGPDGLTPQHLKNMMTEDSDSVSW